MTGTTHEMTAWEQLAGTFSRSCCRLLNSCISMTVLLALCPGLPATEPRNFTSSDADFLKAAESARERSARFWSGRALPGDWYVPCPMVWSQTQGAASGWTSFQIQRGEVFDWRMTLRGERSQVLADVIPHEVDHTVRASLCRRPLPRWLDEGCASLFESEASHAQLRSMLGNNGPRMLTASTLDMSQYPTDSQDLGPLYAEGFSFVEYLLTIGNPKQLLEIQQSSRPISQSLVRVYRQELPHFIRDWTQWQRQRNRLGFTCSCTNCPYHKIRPKSGPLKPILKIWTAAWCEPCQRLHTDLRTAPGFQQMLDSHFQIVWQDWDLHQSLAVREQVQAVPTFQWGTHKISGYQGPDWLLTQLGLETTVSPTWPSPASPSSADQSPSRGPPDQSPPDTSPPPEQLPSPSKPTPVVLPKQPSLSSVLPPSAKSESSLPSKEKLRELVPVVISILTSLGVISGSALTGGAGGVALMLIWKLIQRRATRSASDTAMKGGQASPSHAPFPRELDEAGELLVLRQSEGRVAALDALRGMFLDDELTKLHDSADPATVTLSQKLRAAIDKRVDEVAPLSTKG